VIETGRVGRSPVGELDVDITLVLLLLGAAVGCGMVAHSRVGEVRREMIKLAGARESAQEQEASARRELDQARSELAETERERDQLRARLNPDVGD
jgi:uncharacterized protein (DUF3084 family)